ncbi:uncharacterized protein [Halyomorpha halys]|uniref:uncharacterized protein n=1 Tax=Halyomorpha halys TaxID=286706 RepID=UPI0034D3451E
MRTHGFGVMKRIIRQVMYFIYSGQCDFVDNVQKQPTLLSYKGDQTHPDIVLCHPSLTRKIKHDLISPPGGAGHKILIIEVESRTLRTELRESRWNLKRARWEDYRRYTNIMIKEDIRGPNVDQIAQTLTKIILICALRNILRGQVRKFKPYWNIELEKLKKGKDDARCREKGTGVRSDMVVLGKTSAQLSHAIICYKKPYSNFLKEMAFRKDGKKAHVFISRINGEKIIEYEPIKIESKLVTTEKDLAEVFCKNYCKISNVTLPEKIKNQDLLENLGCLNLDNSMLLFTLFKIGTGNCINDYKPISLTSSLCKLVERMVIARAQEYLEPKKLLSDRQAGFRKTRNTVEQVIRISQEVKDGFERRQYTLAVFIDFQAAFDCVWRKNGMSVNPRKTVSSV